MYAKRTNDSKQKCTQRTMDVVRGAYDYGFMAKKPTKQRRPTFIRQWRMHHGLTLEVLAERIGVSHPTLGRIEIGKMQYNQDHLENLAREFECTPADLLTVNPLAPPVSALSFAEKLVTLMRVYAPEKGFPVEARDALSAALLGERYTPTPRQIDEKPSGQPDDAEPRLD